MGRVMPFMLRVPLRLALRFWAKSLIAPGYCYQMIERWGPRLAPAPMERAIKDGLEMSCDLSDHVQRQIYFFGFYEPLESYLFEKLLRPGMTVIDAGANVGQYSLLASQMVGQSGSVHSFEPVPKNFERLKKNVKMSRCKNVRLWPVALWSEHTELKLGLGKKMEGNRGAFSVAESFTEEAVVVKARVFDEIARTENLGPIDLIKMDIEGAELFALRGMRETLARHLPTLLLEVRRDTYGGLGYSPEDLWAEIFKPLGYRAWRFGTTSAESGVCADLSQVKQANLILHHRDLPSSVTSGWTLKSALHWAQTRTAPLKSS